MRRINIDLISVNLSYRCHLWAILFSIFCFITFLSFGENKKIDSLRNELSKVKYDTSKVNILNDLTFALYDIGKFDTALICANKSLSISKSINYRKGLAFAHIHIGEINDDEDNFNVAMQNFYLALNYAKEIHNKKAIMTALNDIGILNLELGNRNEALKNHLEGLKMAKEIGNKKAIGSSYTNIGRVYSSMGDYNRAVYYFNEALKTLLNVGSKKSIGNLYLNMGIILREQGNFNEAIQNFQSAKKIFTEIEDQDDIAYCYVNIGNIYFDFGNYPEDLKNQLTALKILSKIGDRRGMAGIYISLGNIYSVQNNFPEALKNYTTSISISKEIGDKESIGNGYANLGGVNEHEGNVKVAQYYYLKALEIQKEMGNKKNMAIIYNNLGNTYRNMKLYANAQKCYTSSLELSKVLNSSLLLGDNYINLSYLYVLRKKPHTATEFAQKAMLIGKQINNPEIIKNAYDQLYLIDSSKNNFRSAFEDYKMFITYRDLLYNKEKDKKLTQLAMQYEFSKKEDSIRNMNNKKQTIASLKLAQSQKQERGILTAGLIIIFLCLTVIILLWQRSKTLKKLAQNTEKESKRKIDDLLYKQELKTMSAMLEGQETERKRIAAELHDRIGATLAMVKLQFTAVEEKIEHLKLRQQPDLNNITGLLDNACKEVSLLARNMDKGVLSQYGLLAALTDLKNVLESSKKIKVKLMSHGMDVRLPRNIETELYRMIQELISNSLKHSGADQISIQVNRDEDKLFVFMEDNGHGFIVHNAYEGMGIRNLHNRAENLNGKFTLESVPGRGTTAIIEVPIVLQTLVSQQAYA